MRYRFTKDDSRKGGLTTLERHGRTHMRHIGSKGFERTCQLYYYGDRQLYTERLRERGLLNACDQEFVGMLSLYQERLPELF